MELKQRYELACIEYIKIFEKKHDLQFDSWVGSLVGGIAHLSDYFVNFDDIRHDIDTQQPKEHFKNWYDDQMRESAAKFNYRAYTMGLRKEHIKQ